MSHNIVFDPDLDLALIKIEGALSLDECIQIIEEFPKEPEFKEGQRVLVDLRELILKMGNLEVGKLARMMFDQRKMYGEIALLVGQNLSFQINMFNVFTDLSKLGFRVFESAAEVNAWAEGRNDDQIEKPAENKGEETDDTAEV